MTLLTGRILKNKQRNQTKPNKTQKRKPSQPPELIDTENRLVGTRCRRWAKRVKVVKMKTFPVIRNKSWATGLVTIFEKLLRK